MAQPFVVGLVTGLALAAVAPGQKRPNVLFLISDDLTAESLGCHGNRQCRTPAIDALAARGMRFTRAYCQFPVCGPSRAALMSGMYAQSVGVTGNGAAARLAHNLGRRPTLPQLFKEHGYHTVRVSKIYHMRVPGDITAGVDGPDHAASWTERFNCQAPEWRSEGEHEQLSNQRLQRDPDKHYDLGFGSAFYVVRSEGDGTEQADAQAAEKAIEVLGRLRDRPFFLAVGLVRPHVPLVAPAKFFAPYPAAKMTLPTSVADDQADIPKLGISMTSQKIGLAGNDEKKQKVLAAYYAAVSFMDAQVGRILRALDDLGLADHTIVVFTSDHGYHLGEHDFWQKMSLHEESVRIPLLIAAPGRKPGVSAALAQQIDLYPTLTELCGLPVPDHVQGRSLVPLFDDPAAVVHDAVYCFRGTGHLLRTPGWALLAWQDDTAELYDMEQDPRQFRNLAGDPQHAGTLRELRKALAAKLVAMEDAGKAKPKDGAEGERKRE